MEETRVTLESPKCNSHCSSQSNPFELLKNPMDIITGNEQAHRSTSISPSRDFFDIGQKSLSFSDFGIGDFGKESMGILPSDFGRNSSGFMNLNSSEFGRESLGILHIDALRDSLSFRRESLGIFNLMGLNRDSLDSGRESLGILHLKPADFNFFDEKNSIPDILLTTVEKNDDFLGTTLNRALLNPQPRKTSSASSSSSANPFNSLSLEGPSKIYSLSSMKNFEDTKSDILNRAFFNTIDFSNVTYASSSAVSSVHSPFNKGRLFSPNELHMSPARIKSLPATSRCSFEDETSAIGRHFWTTDRSIKTKTLEERNFHEALDFDDSSSDFHDSVFIEGHHIAEKIADGSILNDSVNGETGILDSTPQPEWPDESSENEGKEREEPRCNTETVFKNVDKLLPTPILNTDFKIKTSKTDGNSPSETSGDIMKIGEHSKVQTGDKCVSNRTEDGSDIADVLKKLSIGNKNQSKSKHTKEILHNLSEILNCSNRSEMQKSEGQYLLNSLADILCKNNEKNVCLDDSGHSSIIDDQSEFPDSENHEYFKVVDLCANDASEGNCNVSDKNNTDIVPKAVNNIAKSRLTHLFSSSVPNIKTLPLGMKKRNSSTSGLDLNKNKSTASSNSSVNSNDSKNSNNSSRPSFSGSLRRKNLSYISKKGPLKAVIPIGDMKKQNNVVTPERAEQKLPSISNRTSTPIKEPKLKPMAASTPTSRPIREKNITPISPLARSNKENASLTMGKAGGYTTPSKTSINPGLPRRNSVSEVKRTSKNVDKIARSNSIEKGTGIMSSLAKVRQNIVNSPYYQSKKQNVLKEINTSNIGVPHSKEKSRGNRSLPEGSKPTNLGSKFKPNTDLHYKGSPIKRSSSITKCSSARKEVTESCDTPKSKIHKLTTTRCQARNTESKPVKATSSDEFKKTDDNTNKPTRRNSLGIMSSLPKIRHNILTSPHYQLKKENLPTEEKNKSAV